MQLQLHICLICDVICYVLVELTLLGKFINILVCKKKTQRGMDLHLRQCLPSNTILDIIYL